MYTNKFNNFLFHTMAQKIENKNIILVNAEMDFNQLQILVDINIVLLAYLLTIGLEANYYYQL